MFFTIRIPKSEMLFAIFFLASGLLGAAPAQQSVSC